MAIVSNCAALALFQRQGAALAHGPQSAHRRAGVGGPEACAFLPHRQGIARTTEWRYSRNPGSDEVQSARAPIPYLSPSIQPISNMPAGWPSACAACRRAEAGPGILQCPWPGWRAAFGHGLAGFPGPEIPRHSQHRGGCGARRRRAGRFDPECPCPGRRGDDAGGAGSGAQRLPSTKVIAVTMLTSLSDEDLPSVGLTPPAADQVLRLATLAHNAAWTAWSARRTRSCGCAPRWDRISCWWCRASGRPAARWATSGG